MGIQSSGLLTQNVCRQGPGAQCPRLRSVITLFEFVHLASLSCKERNNGMGNQKYHNVVIHTKGLFSLLFYCVRPKFLSFGTCYEWAKYGFV